MYFTRALRIQLTPSFFFRMIYPLAALLILLHAQSGLAETIYRSTDSHGHTLYSDIPTPAAKPLQPATLPARSKYRVIRVVDGDTIVLENNKRVRLLGINAPETRNRYHPGEPGGADAKKWLQEKLQGRSVYLEHDRQTHDHYKRILAHLYLPSGNISIFPWWRRGWPRST